MEAVARESRMGFARRLASPKKKTREKAISLLVLWLTSQKQLEEDELKKVWKGLFYCVWHSDKAPVQADLIERLASILEKLDIGLALKFFKVFMITMRREWAGIDRLRLDKFYLLLRKCLSHMFSALQTSGWHADSTKEFMDMLLENAFLAKDQYAALGINLHYADVFLQELESFLPLRADTFKLLLEPFLVVCTLTLDKSLLLRIKENIFNRLFNLGHIVITAKQEGHPVDLVTEVLGSLLLSVPLGPEAFKLASLPSTSQASRKILYELHRELEKLEKLLETTGTTLSLSTGATIKREKEKGSNPVSSNVRPTKKKAQGKKVAMSSSKKTKSALDEGIVATIVLDRGKTSRGSSSKHIVVKESTAPSESKEGEGCLKSGKREESECSESSLFESKDNEEARNEEEKKRSSAKRKKVALVGTGTSEKGLRSVSNGLGMDDSVVSKLEKQFDMLADGRDVCLSPEIKISKTISPVNTGKRKRKRLISIDNVGEGQEALVIPVTTPTAAVMTGNCSGKVKRVRFALKKNLVWTPSTPLPAENVRVPPSATPRGSALKKGVPPGPIISETANTLKQRKGTPMWRATHGNNQKNRKAVMKYMKLLCEQELAKGVKQDLGTLLGGLLK